MHNQPDCIRYPLTDFLKKYERLTLSFFTHSRIKLPTCTHGQIPILWSPPGSTGIGYLLICTLIAMHILADMRMHFSLRLSAR